MAPFNALRRQAQREAAVVAAIVAVGAALRVAAAFDQLWLDEIWTVQRVLALPSVAAILLGDAIDNNHPLTSFFVRAVGPTRQWVWYRLPSVVAGIAALLVFASFVRRRCTRAETWSLVAWMSTSYLFVVWSSEARGYGPLVLFTLLAVDLLDRHGAALRGSALAAFWTSIVLGFLSHLTFGAVLAGLVLEVVYRGQREGEAATARALVRLFAVPLAVTAALLGVYVVDLRLGGGGEKAAWPVVADLFAWLVGLPRRTPAGYVAAALLGPLAVLEIARMLRAREPLAGFLLGAVLLPLLVALSGGLPFLTVRYLSAAAPFLMLLLFAALRRRLGAGRGGTALLGAAVLAVLAGNAALDARLLRLGRGHYLECVARMAAATGEPEVTVSGEDVDFRNVTVLSYYVHVLRPPRRFRFCSVGACPPGGARWFLLYRVADQLEVPASLRVDGAEYALDSSYPYDGGASGFQWSLYRRVPPGTAGRGGDHE